MRDRGSAGGAILMIIVVVLVCWMNACWNSRQCDELLDQARNHSDTLVVMASRPVHNGLSCQQLENWNR